MRALWLENGRLEYRDSVPMPAPATGEALVRVRLAGVCGTDLALLRGYAGFSGIPGHEFVGEVLSAPELGLIGRRVVGEINVGCGVCQNCREHRASHCDHRNVLGIRGRHGAFAEYLALPAANLLPVPDSVPDMAAVFAEPLAAALEIQAQVSIRRADRVLLVGAGRLGQLIARTLALTGCELDVVARYPRQRERLEQWRIRVLDEAAVPAGHFDRVVEATGSPDGFELARRAVRPGGVLILKSTYPGKLAIDLAALVVDEISLVGSRCGRFAPALRLLERGAVDPAGLVDAAFPLSQGSEALAEAARPGTLKILLRP